MIQLHVNGEPRELQKALTVQQALQQWGYSGDSIAVAINGEFVPRSRYEQQQLAERDKVDIVAPIQGG